MWHSAIIKGHCRGMNTEGSHPAGQKQRVAFLKLRGEAVKDTESAI